MPSLTEGGKSMSITININDDNLAMTQPQSVAAVTADMSAGANALLAEATVSTPTHADMRDAGSPSAALIEEIGLALNQERGVSEQSASNAGAAPI
jgi:hypothetical protein